MPLDDVSMDAFDSHLSGVLSAAPVPDAPVLEQNTETVIDPAPAAEELQPPAEAEPELPAELQEILEDEPTQEEAQPPAEAEAEPDPAAPDPSKPNPIDLNSSRGKRIYNGYKFFRAVENELGVLPTVDEIKEFHRAHLERLAMENEFTSGDPRAADNWVANWDRTSPQGMTAVASVLPDRLIADRNFDAYSALATPVIARFANSLYDLAQTTVDPESKARLIDAARIVEQRVTGKFRSDDELTKVEDPLAARQQEINSKLARIQQFEAEQSRARQAAIVDSIDTAIDQHITSTVGQALAALEKAYPDNKSYVKICQKDFTEQVIGMASKSPSIVAYRQEVARAANGDPNARQRAVSLYASMVGHAVQALQRPFLREHIKSSEIVRASQAKHAKLQQAVPPGSAPSTAAPTGRSMAPPAAKGETLDQLMARLMGTT